MDRWHNASNGRKITIVALALLAVAVAFWIPPVRMAILWLLPLGSGIDDLIFVVTLTVGGILLLVRFIAGKKMD